jgi:hypothetical protein
VIGKHPKKMKEALACMITGELLTYFNNGDD